MLESYTTLGLPRRAHVADPPRHDGHRHHVPQRGPPRQDRRHPRRPVRRPGHVRHRRGVVRAGAPRLRLALPAPRRALRPAGGRPRSSCRCCGDPARRRSTAGGAVAEAICYPRPLQERVPILVGGQGERRTLRLVARYADACNLRGDAAGGAPQGRRPRRALRAVRAATRPPSPSPISVDRPRRPRPGRTSTPPSRRLQPKAHLARGVPRRGPAPARSRTTSGGSGSWPSWRRRGRREPPRPRRRPPPSSGSPP